MALKVGEVMNRELASVHERDHVDTVRDSILAMGITSMPVLDDGRHPIGMWSLRDLVDPLVDTPSMRRPVLTVSADATIEQAARLLSETDFHHLVVVDSAGRAVGMVSSVDLLRGVLGLPARHPSAFPHLDPELRVAWSDDRPFAAQWFGEAPNGSGVLLLVRGAAKVVDTIVWAEACTNVRQRLEELLAVPQTETPALKRVIESGELRFRTAAIDDAARRAGICQRIRSRIVHQALPQATAIA